MNAREVNRQSSRGALGRLCASSDGDCLCDTQPEAVMAGWLSLRADSSLSDTAGWPTKRKYLAGRPAQTPGQCTSRQHWRARGVAVRIGNISAGAWSLPVFALFNVIPPTP